MNRATMPPTATIWRVLPSRFDFPRQQPAKLTVNGYDATAPESDTAPKAAARKSDSFPIEVFPQVIQQLIQRCSNDLGHESDFLAGSILAAVSGAVGRSYTICLRPGWIESGVLWMSLVGRPGSGKSHPLRSALTPIFRRDKQLYAEYREAKQAYEKYRQLSKADKENTSEVPEPVLRRHAVSDITLEALAVALRHNDLLLHSDEFRGWLANFNRYNAGSDCEAWLTLWSGGHLSVDRLSREPLRVDNPFCSVVGTTQPGVLESLFKGKTDNGLLDRILFVWPEKITAKTWQTGEVDSSIFVPYNRAINKLLDERPEGTNGLQFSQEAAAVFGKFYDDLQTAISKEQSERQQSLLSKLDIHCARLSLLIQLLRYACDEAGNREVDEVSVQAGIELTRYFAKQAKKVNQHLFERSPVDDLDQTKRAFYEALPEAFTTQTAVALGKTEKYKIPERTVKRFLGERKLFNRLAHGHYGKLL